MTGEVKITIDELIESFQIKMEDVEQLVREKVRELLENQPHDVRCSECGEHIEYESILDEEDDIIVIAIPCAKCITNAIKTTMVEEGVMFMKDGLAYGITHEDGQVTEWDWTNPADPTKVKVYDSERVTKASDITAAFCYDYRLEELEKGTLAKVRRTTIVEIL